jgi:N-acetylglucosaminyl-diphospho-decaprenol L-rhamnosyltransferase
MMTLSAEKPSQSSLSIVIVSYNTVELLQDCLASLYAQLDSRCEVIVVDNASSDGSADMVRVRYPDSMLIKSNKNLGFGRANNRGISMAKGDLIWLLNPDTHLQKNALDAAVTYMVRNPAVGMAGTALINSDGSPQPSIEHSYPGQRYANHMLGRLPGDIAWVMGASIIARRNVLEAVGGFDEQFFLYGEEVDLCLMVRKAGWPLGFVEDSVVMHHGGESERGNAPEAVLEKKFNAEMRFYGKHYSEAIIGKIKRKNRIQAAWRLLTLAPMRLLFPKNRTIAGKFGFYRLSWRFFGR